MTRPFDEDDLERTHVSYSSELAAMRTKTERNRPFLIILSGGDAGQMHKVTDGETVIGRSSTAQVKLTDDGISRKHARIVVDGKAVTIEDLGSANGMFVNGQKVTQAALKDGDQIQLGSTTILKFTYHDSLEEDFRRQMYEAALRDPLTKAFNKKSFVDRLTTELAFAQRHSAPLSLLMFDLDHFKRVNDTYGHLAGDAALVHFAGLAHQSVRAEDIFARYGGEEFVVLARGIPEKEAYFFAERLRSMVEASQVAYEKTAITLTVSSGVATYPQAPVVEPLDLVKAADEALYAAKRNGRNRVISYSQLPR